MGSPGTPRSQPPDERVASMADEIAELRRAREELSLLLDVSNLLGGSLDHEASLVALAGLLVPRLADGCVVDVVDPDGSIRRLVVVVADPAKAHLAQALTRVGPPDPEARLGILALIRAAIAQVAPEVTDEGLTAGARSPEHLQILRALEPRSALILPLTARSRPIGLLWLFTSESGRRYGQGDLVMAQDLAGRAALALDNARLYQRADAAVRARDEFLTLASHELRTPLTSMQLLVQSLVRAGVQGPAAARAPAKLELLARQGARLARLVEQMLEVARIGNGRLDLQPRALDLSALTREVVGSLAIEAADAGCRVDLSADEAVPGVWDPTRIEQALQQLLTNAFKFGAGKPIEIVVSGSPGAGRIVVRDQGIGIEAAHQDRIFDRLERAVSSRHYGGFGLGLWMARVAVEAMGGTVQVESAPEQGSTFTIELPRTARAQVSPAM